MLGLLGGGDGGLDCGGVGCSGDCAGGYSKEALRATWRLVEVHSGRQLNVVSAVALYKLRWQAMNIFSRR